MTNLEQFIESIDKENAFMMFTSTCRDCPARAYCENYHDQLETLHCKAAFMSWAETEVKR